MKGKFKDSFKDDGKVRIFTLPNFLTLFRIVLIPVFVWLYLDHKDLEAFLVLVLSGLTDVLDGIIARRFNMVSAVGKALDPVSDKLTQLAILYCLINRFPAMLIPFVLMIVKELFSAIAAFLAIKKTGEVRGADWHGKINTVYCYGMIGLHIVWPGIPPVLSNILIGISVILMLISFILYIIRHAKSAKKAKQEQKEETADEEFSRMD